MDAHHLRITADRETEKGHPNVTSVRVTDISCVTVRGDFYTVGPNGLPVKSISRAAEAPQWPRCRPAFKLGQGSAGSPGRDPPSRHLSPECGSTDVKGDLVK